MDGGGNGLNDRKITTCKRCNLGIFKDSGYAWVTKPFIGMVHAPDCLNERDVAPLARP